MKLIVDIGNTLTKIAVFYKADIVDLNSIKNLSSEAVLKTLEKYPGISSGIIASVKKRAPLEK